MLSVIAFARDYVFPVALLALILVIPNAWGGYALVVGGQAHFAMAYLYQWKAGKMNWRYLLSAVAFFVLALWYFSSDLPVLALVVFVNIIFGIHFAFDEVGLHGEKWTLARASTVVGFSLFYGLFQFFLLDRSLIYLPLAVAALFFAGALARLIRKDIPSASERYLFFVGALVLLCGFFVPSFPIEEATLFVVWVHVGNWLISYGIKVHAHKERRMLYWRDTFLTAGGALALFLVFLAIPQSPLRYIFDLNYYYAWAAAHIGLSLIAQRVSG